MEENSALTRGKGVLDANTLKYAAVVAMLIDHIAEMLVDRFSPLGQIMHLIGRLTAPTMCYFAAEGFHYTRSLKKYLSRLGIFAIISHFPFVIFEYLKAPPIYYRGGKITLNPELLIPQTGVIFTIFLGVLALAIWQSSRFSKSLKTVAVIIICLFSCLGDWMFFPVLWILIYGVNRGNIKAQLIGGVSVASASAVLICCSVFLSGRGLLSCFWQLGVLAAPFAILLYNGKRGSGKPFHKWFFYVFYPAHLLILGLLRLYVFEN